MQATVETFDGATHSGSVLLDDGTRLLFDGSAFDAGPLLRLRPGQRVTIVLTDGRVSYVTLVTFPVP